MTQVADRQVNELVTIIRPSFTKIAQGNSKKPDACRGAAFNHILYWIARKSRTESKEAIQQGKVTWYASNEQITEDMSHSWGVCKVAKEVNELVKIGLLGRCNNPTWGADRTKHFFFGENQCTLFLKKCEELNVCILHLGLPVDMLHLINLSNASDKNIKCICSKHKLQTIDLENASDKSMEAIPQGSTQITTHATITHNVATSIEDCNTPSLSLEENKSLVNGDTQIPIAATTPDTAASTNVQTERADSATPSVPYQVAISKHMSMNTTTSQDVPEVTGETATPPDAGNKRGRGKKAAQPELLPEELDRLREQKEQEKRDEARRKAIRERIEARRGYKFKGNKFLNECVYVKKLSEEYEDAQIEAINKYMFERHWKYSKPDNKFKFGAYEMYEEAPSIAQILREERIAIEQGKKPTNINAYRKSNSPQRSDDPRIAATAASQPTVTAINEASEEILANWDEEAFLASLDAQLQQAAL